MMSTNTDANSLQIKFSVRMKEHVMHLQTISIQENSLIKGYLMQQETKYFSAEHIENAYFNLVAVYSIVLLYYKHDNWEVLIKRIEQNYSSKQQYSVLKALRKVAKNLLLDNLMYRILYTNNKCVQKKILNFIGGYEFLGDLGFKEGTNENELCCESVDQITVCAAIDVLNQRIKHLKQNRNEWDPKYKIGGYNHTEKMQVIINEEERQLHEAVRISQNPYDYVHGHDVHFSWKMSEFEYLKYVHQERELDAEQQKSVNIHHPNDENDEDQ
eukprot:99155_1